MLLSLLLIFAITAGGFALTYLIENEKPFIWRVAAGNVTGCAVFGTFGFLLAMLFGLSPATVIACLIATLLPILLIWRGNRRKTFERDWARAKNRVSGAGVRRVFPFFYYAAFLLLFIFFFDRALIETDQGIFTGGSNNLGDISFHLGAIYAFTETASFPPQYPSYAGAKFTYPFIADLVTAMFLKLGVNVREAMLVQNVGWAFSLLVILESFVFALVRNRTAARIAPLLLFFSGGLGFLWFFWDFWNQGWASPGFIWKLNEDYTIGDIFRWGNSLTTLFLTQRSMLLGMPLTLVIVGGIWRVFASESVSKLGDAATVRNVEVSPGRISNTAAVVLGLLAGSLVLIHLHSLFALFVFCAFLTILRADAERMKTLMLFGLCTALVAVPELLWSLMGSATHSAEFVAWHFGWDKRGDNFVWFWIKNTGLLIALIAAGLYLIHLGRTHASIEDTSERTRTKKKKKSTRDEPAPAESQPSNLLLFYVPVFALFLVPNVAKLAPWEWDNIKVLAYWFVLSLPFAALTIAWIWQRGGMFRPAAAVILFSMTASGGLDVWRTVSGQINYKVFDADAVTVANRIKASTQSDALFLNAPTYNTAVVLTGRRSLMRYTGHLSSHGVDYREREEDVKRMYRGGPDALGLVQKYGVEYVLISPEERGSIAPNEEFFKRFPVVAEAGQYKVYKVKD